ncbi:hypothetical protein PAXRUDRAFT_162378, partial [Paxillus rubicundulus Ve08.2h10]
LPPSLPQWALHQPCQNPSVLHPDDHSKLINKATLAALLKLHQHHCLKVHANNKNVWELLCSIEGCEQWVKTGIKSHVPLLVPGQFITLEAHISSNTCGKKPTR